MTVAGRLRGQVSGRLGAPETRSILAVSLIGSDRSGRDWGDLSVVLQAPGTSVLRVCLPGPAATRMVAAVRFQCFFPGLTIKRSIQAMPIAERMKTE